MKKPSDQSKASLPHIKHGTTDAGGGGGTVQLKRTLGLAGGISFIVGGIVGSGIFVSPKGVLEATGSVGLSLIVWLVAGIISLMGALCYAELGTMLPKTGGDYAYIQAAFGNLPAFLFTWVFVFLLGPAGNAVKVLTFSTYLTTLFHYCGAPTLPVKLVAVTCIVTLMLINIYSAKMAVNLQIMTTVSKVTALGLIAGGGIYKMANGYTEEITSGFQDSTSDPTVIALAFYDALWAYSGWNGLNFVTEELQNPSKNLPRAIIFSLSIVIVIYLLTYISYLSVMTKAELLASDAVAVLWGNRVLTSAAVIIPLAVMASTFGSANGSIFSSGRNLFSAARDGNLPQVLGFINIKRLTPLPGVLLSGVLCIIYIFMGEISTLINFISFAEWFFFGVTFSALIYFRFKRKDAVRPYKVPIVIPFVMVIVCIFLVIAPVASNPSIEFLYASLFIVGGAVFYFPFVHFKLKVPGIDTFTMYAQLIMEVAPSTKYIE